MLPFRPGATPMKLLHYLEIRNFRRFGERQRIELDHPAVLIGPEQLRQDHGHPGDCAMVAGGARMAREQG